MGFKVNLKEVNNNLTALTKSVKQLDTRLDASKNALNKIVTSNSIYGATGKAITNDINNNQSATLVGFEDMTTELIQEYEDLIQEFQSTVGETDASAVMNEDALNKFKQDLNGLLTDRSSIDSTFQQAYNLANGTGEVSLSMPKSSFNSDVSDVTKDVSDVISKVQAFNSRKVTSQSEALLDKLTKQIHSFAGYGSTSFSNQKLQTFMASGSFASNIETADKGLTNEETQEIETLTNKWETENPLTNWVMLTPAQRLQYSTLFSQYLSKYGIKLSAKSILVSIGKMKDDPHSDDSSLVNFMSDAIKDSSYVSTVNVASKEATASLAKIKNGTWYKSAVNSTKTGEKTWQQVSGDVNRFKSVKGAKSLDEVLNGTGKISDGLKGVGVLGGAGAALDGITTYEDRKSKYGTESAAIDGTVHTATAVGSLYVGAAIGTAIPIPVVGTVAGAVGGYVVGGIANTIYDGLAHGTWNLDNFKLW